jgi:hypothetical protein
MGQKIEPLSVEDARHSDKQRAWVKEHYAPASQYKYDTVDGKLNLLQTIINARWIEPTETWKLQSLGITFGDALAQHLGLAWVVVEDERGRTPSLNLDGTTILVFPLTAISKRIERGEQVNVFDLFKDFGEAVNDMRAKGY